MFRLFWFLLRVLAKAAVLILVVNTLSSMLLDRQLSVQELLAFEDLPEKIRFLIDVGTEKLREFTQSS